MKVKFKNILYIQSKNQIILSKYMKKVKMKHQSKKNIRNRWYKVLTDKIKVENKVPIKQMLNNYKHYQQ